MAKYRKLPVEIEAFQWGGQPPQEWPNWARVHMNIRWEETNLQIDTEEGAMRANRGDWIIKGVNGELYPCKDDIFRKTYERVSE